MVDIAGSEQKQVVMSLETVSAQDVVPLPTSYWPGCDFEQSVPPRSGRRPLTTVFRPRQ